ncbi:TonB-dependent receptor [Kordiimonas lipolytica]|uniref:TonB-dependent receptor n=1 Tax=Kordiimonas lipolytica TaxID=1662421 RepID=A0ABV8UEB5_9PROT|nr:TonB-dependent receptor [Kordiimonas lipolytica]
MFCLSGEKLMRSASVIAISVVGLPAAVSAQDAGASDGALMEEIVISGSRLPASIESMPGSVTIIGEEELGKQLAVTTDLEAILGQLVPGMGTSSASPANFTTSLRGRKPVVFIDGVPITPTLNDVGRELRLIDPAVIQRIEVVRGSSALYGNSAGAGFINYITGPGRKGESTFTTEVGTQFSLTDLGNGFRPSIRQSMSGGGDSIDYVASGYYEKVGGFFDADGDRIAPIPNGFSGLADSDIYSLYGKIGFDFAEDQRLEASINKYRQKQDTDYTLLAGDVSEGIKATAIPKDGTEIEEADQFHSNLVGTLTYTHDDIMGTGLTLQGYYQRSKSVFDYNPNRFPLTDKASAQSDTESKKYGFRLDLRTPLDFLSDGAELLWGADYLHDDTVTGLVDGREFAPTQVLKSRAVFGQLFMPLFDKLTLTAGVRHEKADLTIEDFTSLFTLAEITGGTLEYSATPVNIGLTYDVSDTVSLFGGFSQGFEVASVGRVLRSYPVDVNVVILDPEPNLIDSYEGGVRTHFENFSTELAVFYTTSTNALTFSPDPNNPANNVIEQRTADEVYGIEFTFNADLSDTWRVGGSYTWLEGKEDRDLDGTFERYIQHRRIPPRKITGYVEHDFADTWSVRVQGLYSGSRKKFPGSTAFWEGDVNDWFLLDVSVSGEVGPGTLIIGVNNALNTDYFTHISETAQRDDRYSKAPGATASIRYRISY